VVARLPDAALAGAARAAGSGQEDEMDLIHPEATEAALSIP
jgi:hypothetical protein